MGSYYTVFALILYVKLEWNFYFVAGSSITVSFPNFPVEGIFILVNYLYNIFVHDITVTFKLLLP